MSASGLFKEQSGNENRIEESSRDTSARVEILGVDDVAFADTLNDDKRRGVTISYTAMDVCRGVSRLLLAEGYSPIAEFSLSNNRRMDVAAVGIDGTMLGVEIKVSVADLRADDKWPDYLPYCDLFFFAVHPDFPQHLLPPECGMIVADKYGGAIIRPARRNTLHPSRRRAVTLRFAKQAADRLARVFDPASFS
jgi:hypothetical protein